MVRIKEDKRMTLESYILMQLNDLERHAEFALATDTVRVWIDQYNDLKTKK